NSAGTFTGNAASDQPVISHDGSSVAFQSSATDLVAGVTDLNQTTDVFARAAKNGTTQAISPKLSGLFTGNNESNDASVSTDGRFVVFVSSANELVPNDFNNNLDVFVENVATGVITLVSVTPSGSSGDNASFAPAISADGHYVTFVSSADN